jgi:hypothetical protein
MEPQVIRHGQPMVRRQMRVERCVEQLCEQGCKKVADYIEVLQAGRSVPGMEGLNKADQAQVLRELVSIMSVYQRSCGCK